MWTNPTMKSRDRFWFKEPVVVFIISSHISAPKGVPMVTRKKSDLIQLSKIRMREALRARLARDAERKGITLNGEIVDRLEQSYLKDTQGERDAAIIDMLVKHNDVGSQLLRDIADEIAKHPDWANSEAGRKDLIHWLYIAAYGKEPPQESRPGEEL
jgi:hypothetical protein